MQKPSAEEALAAYKRINSGYRRKAVFQLTSARGYGCVLNQAVLAVLYCLAYKFQFQLGAVFWRPNKQPNQGWGVFVPFCSESSFQPPHAQSIRAYSPEYIWSWKRRHPFVLNLNFALEFNYGDGIVDNADNLSGSRKWLWPVMALWYRRQRKRYENLCSRHFLFSQLGIDGDIFHAKSVIAKIILQPATKVADEHRKAMKTMKPYIAVHVRRGDKLIRETKKTEVSKYLEKIQSLAPDTRTVFVATDDYRVVSEFRKLRPDLNIVTLCDKDKEGHFQREFKKSSDKVHEEGLNGFLADLYYLENADHFIGTYSSNVGRLVALLRGGETCHSLDREWHPGQTE